VNRFLIACFAATSYCSLAATADATPVQNVSQPNAVVANTTQHNNSMPSMLAALQNEIQMLRTDVQTLGNLEGHAPGDPSYAFAAEPPPNPGDAPIPSGG
jgi:hypothetical protein